MSSDFIQHAETERAFLPQGMRAAPQMPVKTGAAEAEAYRQEKDSWRRTMSAAAALLNKAYAMISQAEAIIAERESRIRALEDLSLLDELTGLLNRKGFFEAFCREIGRSARGAEKGGLLILIDADNFHAVNKLYGQEAGDMGLRMIANVLRNEIRPMDVAARLGADEFVLLLADTDRDRAMGRAQHLALRLNNLSFIWHGAEVCISASLGLKNYGENARPEDIFRAADRHLQSNKEEKRSRMKL